MASLIEEFLYKFTADTGDYDEATKKVADGNKKAVDTMKQTDQTAAQLAGQFKTLAAGVLGTAAALLSFAGIKAIAVAAAEQTDALDKQARALRMSADTLDVWQRANEAAGGSASEMAATFKMLQDRTRDPIKALEDIADRFKGLNDLQADKLGASLGLDKGTIEMMRQGKAGLIEFIGLQQKLGQVTGEQLAVSRDWKLQNTLNKFLMDDIGRMIMAKLLPGATEWLKSMRAVVMWMRDNKEFTLAFFGAIATVLTARLIPALLAAGLAAAPWILLAAAVAAVGAAVALVVDDVLAFEDGSKSMIGEISKSWPVVGQIVHAIVDALLVLRDVAGAAFKFLRDAIFEPANALENLEARLGAIMDAFETRFPKLAALVKVLGAGIGAYFSVLGSVFSAVFEGIMNVGKAIAWVAEKIGLTSVLKGVGNAVLAQLPTADSKAPDRYQSPDTSTPQGLAAAKEAMKEQRTETPLAKAGAAVQAGRAAVANAESSPLASTTSNAISNTVNNKPVTKTTQVTTGPITVNTQATDGKEVAAALGKGLAAQTKSAVDETDNGIAI